MNFKDALFSAHSFVTLANVILKVFIYWIIIHKFVNLIFWMLSNVSWRRSFD